MSIYLFRYIIPVLSLSPKYYGKLYMIFGTKIHIHSIQMLDFSYYV